MSDNPLILQYSDGQLVPYQPPDPAQAAQRALDFTGIPDLVSGANALARGEYLPGLGQAAAGASAILPLGKLAGAAKLGAELMPLAGIVKAWHGTPHMFEPVEHNPFGEFRDAAIGTGEGSQAYGHGHYVVGNQWVAEDYRRNLSENSIQIGNSLWNPTAPYELIAQHALESYPALGNQPNAAVALTDLNKRIKQGGFFEGEEEAFKRAAQFIETNKDKMQYGSGGSLLEVHILPDEHELLDWEKPLGEQSEGVKAVIDKIHAKNENLRTINSGSNITGEDFYRNLAQNLFGESRAATTNAGQIAASRYLHEAGIPGIKYFESLHKQLNPISGYVIFDPKNLRIVGRNGQRLEPVEEDPFK